MRIVTSLKEAKELLEEYCEDQNAEIVKHHTKRLYAVCAGYETHMADYYLEGGQ